MATEFERVQDHLESENYAEALRLLKQLLASSDNEEDKAYYLMHMFTCLTRLGRAEEAYPLLEEACKRAPARSRFPLDAGIAYASWEIEQGKFRQALDRLLMLEQDFRELLEQSDEQANSEYVREHIGRLRRIVMQENAE